MTEEKGRTKRTLLLPEEEINAEECILLRLSGSSFDDLADMHGVTKAGFCAAWNRLKKNGGLSYEPIPRASLVRSLAEADTSFASVALSHGCTVKGLRNYMLDLGIPKREIDMEKVSGMLRGGMSVRTCAEHFGVSYGTMQAACKKSGISSERAVKLKKGNAEKAKNARITELERENAGLRERIAELEALLKEPG